MRYQFYREHKFVSAALNDLERLIARTDFCDPEAVKVVKTQFQGLSDMLKGHAHYENERLHALLKKKNVPEDLYEHIEEDHVVQDQKLAILEEIIQNIIEESDNEKKIEEGYSLYLTYRKFVADNLAHLHEEETLILPALQKLYSDEELRQVEAPSYKEMTPEQIVEMVHVLFPHMNPHDKQAFLGDIRVLEPQKFAAVKCQLERNA